MILKRIKEYIDAKGISISAFEKSVGMSNGAFGKCLHSGGAIGSDKLEKILNVYKDISPYWLMCGEGSMERSEVNNQEVIVTQLIEYIKSKDGIIIQQAEEIGRLKSLVEGL